MSTPIVLAHLEGDDAAGVRLAACTGCGGTLVRAAATCDRCRLPPTRARVMAALRGAPAPMRPRDVVQATGLPSRAVWDALDGLARRCNPPRATRVGNGRYGVAS